MIQELVVTSAPRGLQAGRSGFTTVLRTRGIHPDLAARLEAASAYRHVHPQGDPRNPVIFCYAARASALGEAWVMSRIGDAGTDYTGRSNKIAHHVALQAADLAGVTASNPAAVMAAMVASRGLLTRWEGDPRESPTPPVLPLPPSAPGVCQRWAAAAGDAGWAGVLVERALNREQTWVIAPPGVDLLSLFAEALALVSPAQRWQIPFTTYSLRGDEGRWLGTTAGSPEASAALAQNRLMVIDLTRRGPAGSAGPYVRAARGEAAVPWQRPGAQAAPGRSVATLAAGGALGTPHSGVMPGTSRPVSAGLPPMPPRPGQGSGPDDGWEELPLDRPRSGRLVLLAGVAAVLLIAGILVGGAIVFPEAVNRFLGRQVAQREAETEQGPITGGPESAPRVAPAQEPPVSDLAGDPAGGQSVEGSKADSKSESKAASDPDEQGDGGNGAEAATTSGTSVAAAPQAAAPPQPRQEPAGDPTAVANEAFERLMKGIKSRAHLPHKALVDDFLTAEGFTERRGVLCDVGETEIEVALPEETFDAAAGTPYRLKADAEEESRSWVVRAVPGPSAGPDVDSDGKPLEVGRIIREGTELVAVINASDVATDLPEGKKLATIREAFVTAAVKIANRNDPKQAVFVQIGAPVERPAVEVKRFFFDSTLYPAPGKANARPRPCGEIALPRSPWPVRLKLAASGDGVEGTFISGTTGRAGDVQFQEVASGTMRWSRPDQGDPLLWTEMGIGPMSSLSGTASLRILSAATEGSWGSSRQLGEIKDSVKDGKGSQHSSFQGMRSAEEFAKHELEVVPYATIKQLAIAKFKAAEIGGSSPVPQLDKIAKNCFDQLEVDALADKRPRLNQQLPLVGAVADGPTWHVALRSMLAQTNGYRGWLERKYPKPELLSKPPTNKKELEQQQQADNEWHQKMGPKYMKVDDADYQALRDYLRELDPKACPLETLICLVLADLEPLAKDKRAALELIRSLGEGNVVFSGDISVAFPSIDATSVLMRLAAPEGGESGGEAVAGAGN